MVAGRSWAVKSDIGRIRDGRTEPLRRSLGNRDGDHEKDTPRFPRRRPRMGRSCGDPSRRGKLDGLSCPRKTGP